MNNWFLVLAIILAAGISIGLSYESLYNYSTYVIPIKNVNFLDDGPTAHIDSIKIGVVPEESAFDLPSHIKFTEE